jgi:preprotein translocase subunit SecG
MSTLETILLILLVLNAIALGALVLLQQGKGADIGAAFGSGASSTVFGGAGSASFLAKLTAWLAIGFFLLSLGLAFTAKERAASLQDLGLPTVVVPETATDVPKNDAKDLSTALPSDVPTDVPMESPGGSVQPAPDAADATAPQTLTAPSEPVDSDIPDA